MLKKAILFVDCVYWVLLGVSWFFKGAAEVFSAISGFLKEFDNSED